ncbi:MAG: hypothetical protein WC477_02465 [Patescibacteria group bacterium]
MNAQLNADVPLYQPKSVIPSQSDLDLAWDIEEHPKGANLETFVPTDLGDLASKLLPFSPSLFNNQLAELLNRATVSRNGIPPDIELVSYFDGVTLANAYRLGNVFYPKFHLLSPLPENCSKLGFFPQSSDVRIGHKNKIFTVEIPNPTYELSGVYEIRVWSLAKGDLSVCKSGFTRSVAAVEIFHAGLLLQPSQSALIALCKKEQ